MDALSIRTKVSLVALVSAGVACAGQTPPPQELVNARAELVRAHSAATAQLDPTDVHVADLALQRAERAFDDEPTSGKAIDLAVVAQLDALAAETTASALEADQRRADVEKQIQQAQARRLASAQGNLAQARAQLDQTQQQLDSQRQETDAERARRLDAESKLRDARDTLARIAQVKDDERGMIVTFQGESLFRTGQATLLPAAMVKLDQVAETLKTAERRIQVVGHTDSVGGVGQYNQNLSEKRALAVRDYLVAKGIPADLVSAEGKGATQPVADNTSIEGRAANRRVEIIVQPKGASPAATSSR